MPANTELQARMFALVEQWQLSGLNKKAFCQQKGMAYGMFFYWQKRYLNKTTGNSNSSASFVQVGFSKDMSMPFLEILAPKGHKLIFHQLVSCDFIKALID